MGEAAKRLREFFSFKAKEQPPHMEGIKGGKSLEVARQQVDEFTKEEQDTFPEDKEAASLARLIILEVIRSEKNQAEINRLIQEGKIDKNTDVVKLFGDAIKLESERANIQPPMNEEEKERYKKWADEVLVELIRKREEGE